MGRGRRCRTVSVRRVRWIFEEFQIFCAIMGCWRSGGTAVCGESVVMAVSGAAGVARVGWSCRCRRGRFGLLVPPPYP